MAYTCFNSRNSVFITTAIQEQVVSQQRIKSDVTTRVLLNM